ncbi:MAG: hypothetical protein U0573_01120 [Phycisphaerales bacterium]|nr:hypothetical protein [Planctomycetota bacterium]
MLIGPCLLILAERAGMLGPQSNGQPSIARQLVFFAGVLIPFATFGGIFRLLRGLSGCRLIVDENPNLEHRDRQGNPTSRLVLALDDLVIAAS